MKNNVFGLLAIFAAVPPAVCVAGDARATTIDVVTFAWDLLKDGKCSLPEAVLAVDHQTAEYDCPAGNGNNDTIQLQDDSNPGVSCGTQYCAVAGMPLTISKNVTILGSGTSPVGGAPETVIEAGGLTSADETLFYVEDTPTAKVSVTFRNVELVGNVLGGVLVTGVWGIGYGVGSTINVENSVITDWGYSGAAVDGMNLNVQSSWFSSNSSPTYGGGIAFTDLAGYGGNLTISQSSFTSNNVTGNGGTGGGLFYSGTGTSTLVNSTIAENWSNGGGGGLELESLGGSFAINGCTIAYNNCGYQNCGGGGVEAFANAGTYSMNASIVGANVDDPTDQDFDDWNSDGSVAESNSIIQASLWGIDVNNKGGNANGDVPFPGAAYTYDQANGQQNTYTFVIIPYGGPNGLPVVVLPAGSPAVDFLSSLDLTTDQRGFPRSVSTGKSKTYDIGAFEYDPNTQAETLTIPGSSAPVAVVTGSGYSDGAGLELKATKVNDYVLLYNPTITTQAEAWTFSARFATGPTEGQVQVQANDSQTCTTSSTFVNLGGPVDLYASKSGGFQPVNWGEVSINPGISNCYRLLVTGKNRASSGYSVYVDYINSTPN